MPEIKIRHGLAFYLQHKEGRTDPVQRTAFRGQIIKVSEAEAKRLKDLGAAVDADEELPLLGRITPLPNTASDQELLAWASVATDDEVARAIAERPALADRLTAAAEEHKRKMEEQNEFLNGLEPVLKEGKRQAKKAASKAKQKTRSSAPTTGVAGTNVTSTTDDDSVHEEDLDELEELDDEEEEYADDDPREVVKGNIDHVSKFLSEHPDQASAVMEAENVRAAKERREVRQGVTHAVTAAAQSNNQ